MTDIADLVATRLSDDELTALLAEHEECHGRYCQGRETHCKAHGPEVIPWPCETVRLATEVRDARAVVEEMREMVRECDSTIAWRNERGMRPATDISIFAPTALSGVIKIKRYFKQALARYEEGGR